MGDPGHLAKLQKWQRDRQRRTDAFGEELAKEAKRLADQSHFRKQLLLTAAFNPEESAYDLHKHYGRDWDRASLETMANDKSLSLQKRAKLVEIMILRGANNDMSFQMMKEVPAGMDLGGIKGAELHEKAMYQLAAQRAVMVEPQLISHLSSSGDQLPSGRVPATELMNSMLQKGGTYGDYDGRQNVEKWMMGLDPDIRGRLMYHIADAAATSDIGAQGRVTGFEVGGGPLSLGLQWENSKDTHWKEAGRDIEIKLADQLERNPDAKESFFGGYGLAEKRLDAKSDKTP